jgi:ATP-dependent DNA helicase RecG
LLEGFAAQTRWIRRAHIPEVRGAAPRFLPRERLQLLQQAGLPKPEIEDAAGCVTVRLRPSRYVPPQRVAHDLSERQQSILALLESSPSGMALREIRHRLGLVVAEWEVKEDLAMLKRLGLVQPRGRGRGAAWFFLSRVPA